MDLEPHPQICDAYTKVRTTLQNLLSDGNEWEVIQGTYVLLDSSPETAAGSVMLSKF